MNRKTDLLIDMIINGKILRIKYNHEFLDIELISTNYLTPEIVKKVKEIKCFLHFSQK